MTQTLAGWVVGCVGLYPRIYFTETLQAPVFARIYAYFRGY